MARATVAGKQILLHGWRTGEKLENRGESAFGSHQGGGGRKNGAEENEGSKVGVERNCLINLLAPCQQQHQLTSVSIFVDWIYLCKNLSFFSDTRTQTITALSQVCMDMVQGSVTIYARLSGPRELQFLLPFVNSYELPDIFWFSGNCCPRRYIQKWPQSTRASSSWLLCRVRETEGPHNPFRG